MGCPPRRDFLTWLASGFVLPIFHAIGVREPTSPALVMRIGAEKQRSENIAEDFRGEELRYRMSVLWIKEAAIGRTSFDEVHGDHLYRATLEGRTVGVIGWLTRYRRDTYTSTMEVVDGGRRLRPLRFEEESVIGQKIRKKITFFDYLRGRLIERRMNRRGVFIQTEEEILPGVIYDDFLTAFYNFRSGVYGEIKRGKRYRVKTLPKAGVSHIDVEIAAKGEEMRMRGYGGGEREGSEYHVTVILDKEITRSRTGKVSGWASRDLVPIEGTIEDVVFVGDVHGFLIGERRAS